MIVVIKIVEGEPPKLEGSCWSEDFKNFVRLCLVKKPRERANGKTLLEHPFLSKAKDANFLKENFLKGLKPVE
jgi:serine/threonine-protein kinase 24/25/MST4